MNIILWVLLGIVAGITASYAIEKKEEINIFMMEDIILGIIGALLGGFTIFLIEGRELSSVNTIHGAAFFTALMGSIIITIFGRDRSIRKWR